MDTKEWERLNGKKVDTAGMTMEPQRKEEDHFLECIGRTQMNASHEDCGCDCHGEPHQERDALVELISGYVHFQSSAKELADAILAAYRLEKR